MLLAGCARKSAPVRPVAHSVRISGATPAETRLLRDLLHGLGPNGVRRVSIGPAEKGWNLPAGALALHVSTAATDRSSWEGQVLASRYLSSAGRGGVRRIALLDSGGASRVGSIAPVRPPGSLAAVRRAVGDARIVELRRQDGAVALVVRPAAGGAAFLAERGWPVESALSRASGGRGTYLAVQRFDGLQLFAGGGAGDWGFTHSRPEVLGCGPAQHEGLGIGPSCPVS